MQDPRKVFDKQGQVGPLSRKWVCDMWCVIYTVCY